METRNVKKEDDDDDDDKSQNDSSTNGKQFENVLMSSRMPSTFLSETNG